jgi:DnaJ like chaperone protein
LQAHSPTVKESMSWYGKIIGAVLGAIIGRGLFGAIVGFLIGHLFDQQSSVRRPGRVSASPRDLQQAFFSATFQVMGHVAKADGRVSEREIDAAREAMQRFSLGEADVRRAIDYFNEGKQGDFPLEQTLAGLRELTSGREDLRRLFIQIQLEAALRADGLNAASRGVFQRICAGLGVSSIEFAALEAMLRMRGAAQNPGARRPSEPSRLSDAYQLLGVTPQDTDAEVRRAYRRLMSRNHPDKLVSSGLPESMVAAAQERTRQILSAYEIVKRHRGMK